MTAWHALGWDAASAAWDARLSADLLRYDQIAELHAVHRLGARFPEAPGRAPTAGYDVLFGGRRVEVKAKEPSEKARSQLYVQPQLSKRDGSDLFWFYLFGGAKSDLEVWEVDTSTVFKNLSIRNGTAITFSRVAQVGRAIWRDGQDCRGS